MILVKPKKQHTLMKKMILALVAICSLAFASCTKESTYVITYYDDLTSFANLTVFEYSYSNTLMGRQEIKDIRDGETIELVSRAGTDFVIIGCEGMVGNRIIEWYTADPIGLDEDETTYIDVDYINMHTTNYNPINPEDVISRYLTK